VIVISGRQYYSVSSFTSSAREVSILGVLHLIILLMA
jgi:hypothetical protein